MSCTTAIVKEAEQDNNWQWSNTYAKLNAGPDVRKGSNSRIKDWVGVQMADCKNTHPIKRNERALVD